MLKIVPWERWNGNFYPENLESFQDTIHGYLYFF